jgi:hypothetical protein
VLLGSHIVWRMGTERVVFMPEGGGGRGWLGFALELHKFLDFFQPPFGGGNIVVRVGGRSCGLPNT